MKKKLSISLCVWLSIMFCCCDRQADVMLERAECYLPAQPDSAAMCLDSIRPDKLDDSQRALYGLLCTAVINFSADGIGSDTLIRESYDYYYEKSRECLLTDSVLLRRYAQSSYYMGVFYFSTDSVEKSDELARQAVFSAKSVGDFHTCYLAHTLLSLIHSQTSPQEAVNQALSALDVYHQINDAVNNEVLIMGHVAASYLANDQPDSALVYYLKGYDLAQSHNLRDAQNSMCMGLADTYCYMGSFWYALYYAKIGVETADSTTMTSSLLSLAQCYYANDSLTQAKAILDTLSCDSDDFASRYLTFRTLSEIALQNRNIDTLYAYVDSVYDFMKGHFSRERESFVVEKEKELEVVQQEHGVNWMLGFIVSAVLVLLLVAGFVYMRYGGKIRLLSMRLLGKVRADSVETAGEPLSLASQHNALIQENAEPAGKSEPLLSVQIDKQVEKLVSYSQRQAEDEKARKRVERAWRNIEKVLGSTHPQFVQHLRQHPGLKEKDFQLCMLTFLKVPNAAIAHIFNIGESAVKKRKSTLKKQTFYVEDASVTLEQVLAKF